MDRSRSLMVLLIVGLAIVGYLLLNQSLAPPGGQVGTTPSVPPAAAPVPPAP